MGTQPDMCPWSLLAKHAPLPGLNLQVECTMETSQRSSKHCTSCTCPQVSAFRLPAVSLSGPLFCPLNYQHTSGMGVARSES